ncbi:hypothetical protein D9M68_305460 [compost metagenome]
MVTLDPEESRERQVPVRENLRIQRVHWGIERIGFVILLALMLLTLLGLFSRGWLSHVHAQTASGGLELEYQRFLRNGATSNLVLTVRGEAGKEADVRIAGAFLQGVTVESLVPQPAASSSHEETGIALRLKPDANGRAQVHLALRSDGLGHYASRVLANGESLELNQFIYP